MEEEETVVDPLRDSTTCVKIAPASVQMENKQNLRARGGEEENEKIFIQLKGRVMNWGDSDVV